MERLQKVLARAGIASRRAAEEIILAGRVRVDGRVVRELGTQVDERRSKVEVDGKVIVAEQLVYLVLHKPRGVVCTLSDPEGRPTIRELLKEAGARVVPVGRLDFHTSGALLCTNDGEFAQALAHPTKEVPKVYVAKVKGAVDDEALDRFSERIVIDGRPTQPAQVKRLRFEGDKTWLEVTLREGRNRQVRRLGEATGFPVMRLARISHAGVTSEDLRPGQWRPLTVEELVDLKKTYGVPKKVHAPQFEPAKPVKKGQRRPARPDIHGEIHDRNKVRGSGPRSEESGARGEPRDARSEAHDPRSESRAPAGGRRFSRSEGRSSAPEARFPRGEARPQTGGARFSRNEGREQSGGARSSRSDARGAASEPRFPRSDARGPAGGARSPRSEGRASNSRSEGRASNSRSEGRASNSRSEGRAPAREARFPRSEGRAPAGEARVTSRKAPPGARGQSPRHEDATLPWKERSGSAIERRTEKTAARQSAERGAAPKGRKTSWPGRGAEKDLRGQSAERGAAPKGRKPPWADRGGEKAPAAKDARAKPYARGSAPRRGTSR